MPVNQHHDDWFPDPGPGQIPALMLKMWGGAFRWNRQVANDWNSFVDRRIQENCALANRLAGCRAPEQVCAAYSDFWQKAVEDCRREQMLLIKRMTNGDAKSKLAPSPVG
jgi:hypothetical protein